MGFIRTEKIYWRGVPKSSAWRKLACYHWANSTVKFQIQMEIFNICSSLGLSLICFLFCLLFYSAILKNLPYYSPQCIDYSLSKTYYFH